MFIIDLRNKLVSKYNFSVINNNNVDVVHIFSHFTQYSVGYKVYLKVLSTDETYVDKIEVDSQNISVEDGCLVVKWTMGAVSTQCKEIKIQLQFENNDGSLIAQSRIVNIVLGDTIDVDQEIEPIYPKVLQHLQEQIDVLHDESFADMTASYNNDVLTIITYNADGEAVGTTIEIAIPLSKYPEIINEDIPLDDLMSKNVFFYIDQSTQENVFLGYHRVASLPLNKKHHFFTFIGKEGFYFYSFIGNSTDYYISDVVGNEDYYVEYVNSDNIDTYISGKVDKVSTADRVYGTDEEGNQTVFPIDPDPNNDGGRIVRRNDMGQVSVPTTPEENNHAVSKQYVDNLVATLSRNSFQVVDTTEYPTLEDFLETEGEEGIIYLYPLDTTDLTKGYYQYIWEEEWLIFGTTQIDLSPYYRKDESLVPATSNAYDLGSSSYTFKDLYLAGNFYNYASSGQMFLYLNGVAMYQFSTSTFRPATISRDLGEASLKWKDLYLSGVIYGQTYSASFDGIYKTIFGHNTADSSITILGFTTISKLNLSANKTFTFATPPVDCTPEYKAILTNTSSSAITITLPSGIKILTNNDEDIIITDNTFVMSAGITCELNIMNNSAIVVVF